MRWASRDPLLAALSVLAAVAVLAAAWFGWSWASAAADDDLGYARERDAALAAATRGLVVLHTLEHTTAERDLRAWEAVTAGTLRSDLAGDRPGQLSKARKQKVRSAASPVRAAVVELDTFQGTARVIAVLRISLGTGGGKPADGIRRMNAELLRVDGAWKVSSIEAAT